MEAIKKDQFGFIINDGKVFNCPFEIKFAFSTL